MSSGKEIYLKAAINIANKICRDAIWDGNRCGWITSNMDDSRGYLSTHFFSTGPDFYGGTSGIAYFLSSVYSARHDEIIKLTAYGALNQAFSRMDKIPPRSRFGLFAGNLGIAYAAIRAGEYFEDNKLVDKGLTIMKDLANTPFTDFGIDVVDGAAGAIPVLISLYAAYNTDEFKELALRLGDHLVAVRQREGTGSSWETTSFKTLNLTGLAHGAAGVSAALFELFNFTGDEKYNEAGMEGIQYENSYFNAQEKNWPDFRPFNRMAEGNQFNCSCAWCHGAPGIGLSRLRAFEITGNEQLKKDALAAIETTLKNNDLNRLGNFSLCHGLFGNAELLLEAARVFNDDRLLAEAEKIAMLGINDYLNESIPFPNGIQNSTSEDPEFMTGTSGMGYFYLRLFDPGMFPSVLTNKVPSKQLASVS